MEALLGAPLVSHPCAIPSLPPSTPTASLQKSSKVLADAMEALLGAFLVAGGDGAALALLSHLGLLQGGWVHVSAHACCQPPGTAAGAAAGGDVSASGGGAAAATAGCPAAGAGSSGAAEAGGSEPGGDADVAAIEGVLG